MAYILISIQDGHISSNIYFLSGDWLCFYPFLANNFLLTFQTNVEQRDRFSKEFGTGDVEEDEECSKTKKPAKRKDFERLFGGNNNDHFMVGIKLTK